MIYQEQNDAIQGEEFPEHSKGNTSLFDEANNMLTRICGPEFAIKSLPVPLAGTEALRDKRIFMGDDQATYFSSFIPSLLVETDGKAKFVLHKDQTVKELADSIIESESDIALLDLNMANGISGTDVARMVKEKGFSGKIIGFSSDMRAVNAFKQVGANGVVRKDSNNQEATIREIVQIITKLK